MQIDKLVLEGYPGAFSVVDASIAYVIPSKICRDNKEFDIVTSTAPGSREARYVASEGRITLADAFTGNPSDDTQRTQIYIKFKY